MLHGRVVGIKRNNRTVAYVSVLISVEDACKAIKHGDLHLFTESQHGIQKEVIVKNTGRSDDKEYLSTTRDPSETNNVEEQPEIP